MAVAGEAAGLVIGAGGLLSTPAASAVIRKRNTDGGLVLSASHNPGGIDEDFGIKFNIAAGGPAPESVSDAIFAISQTVSSYQLAEIADMDLDQLGIQMIGDTSIEIIDPVADYAELMQSLFDFDAIRALFQSGFRMRFDAMHAVTGPYARTLLEQQLGAPAGTVVNAQPLPDFGGGHPDPNPTHAHALMAEMFAPGAPDFAAASDGDGDRNIIVGRGIYVTPSDSLAVLAANAHLAPGYSSGISGIARSMPTSQAADRVAVKLGIPLFETLTGWKFFGNLLDACSVSICGEESAGTGSDHVREKDGVWAVLLWLNVLAVRRESVLQIVAAHWHEFGRNYYSRHDYEAVDSEIANAMVAELRDQLPSLPGSQLAGMEIAAADDFSYTDPVDQSVSNRQGIRIVLVDGSRIVLRLSGTGTVGATVRIYLERYEAQADRQRDEVQSALAPLIDAAEVLTQLRERSGRAIPDSIT